MTVAALLATLGAPAGSAASGGMDVAWWFETEHVVLLMDAPTTGWVAVGFNERPQLAGSRLVMAAVRPSGSIAEEHHARVPDHPRLRDLSVRASEEVDGRTRLVVTVPSDPALAGTMTLAPGVACGLTVAWSHEDDFDHHSAWRHLVEVSL